LAAREPVETARMLDSEYVFLSKRKILLKEVPAGFFFSRREVP
jgi:hypothetical protein